MRAAAAFFATRRGCGAVLALLLLHAGGCAGGGTCGLRECPADARLTAQVRTLLERYPALDGANRIGVQTRHGVVYLRGLVSTPAQIEAATDLAKGVEGVVAVRNMVAVDNTR